MEPRTRWIATGLVAGAVFAAAAFLLAGRGGNLPADRDAGDPDDDERLARLEQRLKSIESEMRAKSATPRVHAEPADRGAADAAAPRDAAAERAATVAEVEDFVAKRLRDEDEQPAAGHRFELGVGDSGAKSLDDAAKELGLRPDQVDRVRMAFRDEGTAQLLAAFGTDDIEAVRRRIRDAQSDPVARTKLQDDLLGNLLRALPKIRKAEQEKVRSLQETLGADGYAKFQRLGVRESDVDEFDALFEQTFGDAAPGGR